MRNVFVFVAVATFMVVGCVPMASTDSHHDVVTDENVTDHSANDSNVVVDETADSGDELVDNDELVTDEIMTDSDEMLATDEEMDSEVSDELADNEPVTDDDVSPIIPEINIYQEIFKSQLAMGEFLTVVIHAMLPTTGDALCINYSIAGATIGVDYGISGTFETCGPGTVVIPQGENFVKMTFTNKGHEESKLLQMTLLEGEGYKLGERNHVEVELLPEEVADEDAATDETSDVDTVEETDETSDVEVDIDTVETDDAVIVDETPEVDSVVEPTDETPDQDSVEETDVDDQVDTDTVESETDVPTDVDETPDVDTAPYITTVGTCGHCQDFLVMFDNAGSVCNIWDDKGNDRGILISSPVLNQWYLISGWATLTCTAKVAQAQGVDTIWYQGKCSTRVIHNGDEIRFNPDCQVNE